MAQIPRDKNLDSTLALLSEGYTFISKRYLRYQSDIFQTRLMLRKAICATGENAARMFYHPDRFTRQGALPPTTLRLLQDKGSVQALDGDAHRRRKQMFMSLMTPESIQRLVNMTADQWRARIEKWETMDAVVVHEEAQEILCRAVCEWAGIALTDSQAKQRTREFGAMIEGAGGAGPKTWQGLWLRARSEAWGRGVIENVRARKLDVPEESAVHVMAWHRNPNGELLSPKVAAVELINVLRPTVAVARFVTFAALALHEYPQSRQRLQADDDDYLELFVQEVRRFYPFFPVIAGSVVKEFDWRNLHFAKGTWVILDLYDTNHDARIWNEPEAFRPERFRHWDGSAFNFIPQGAGDHYDAHRCPGEWITIELMKTALHLLTTAMHYDVPDQDLRIDLSKMPTLPVSRFVIKNVKRV